MKLRHLTIRNFRGIRNLQWHITRDFNGLVGPGDTTKSTILDAISLIGAGGGSVPRYKPMDIFVGANSEDLMIEAVFVDLPSELEDIDRTGLHLCGISPNGEIHDEPGAGDETGIKVRVVLDASLTYEWSVVSSSEPNGKPFRGRDRALLGVTAIDEDIDRHLSWTKGSVLWRLTEQQDELIAALRQAEVGVASALSSGDLSSLDAVVENAKTMAKALATGRAGDALFAQFAELMLSPGNVELASSDVPIKSYGLGTRRLLVMGLQLLAVEQPRITLVDEVEHGLEPHRVTHLLRALIRRTTEVPRSSSQVFMTSHSPVVLAELGADRLSVVRRDSNGDVTVTPIPSELTNYVRSTPEAFLAQSIVVGEGPTEVGLLWGQYKLWADNHEDCAPAHLGVVAVNGQGTEAGEKAKAFNSLGYRTLVFGDSDVDFTPPATTLNDLGISTIQWDGSVATEERLLLDLPWDGVKAMLQVAVDDGREPPSLMNAIRAKLEPVAGARTAPHGGYQSLLDFETAGYTQDELRTAIAAASNKGKWFKRYDLGESISGVINQFAEDMAATDVLSKLDAIETWIYE